MLRPDMFTASSITKRYPKASNVNIEIDLREEFDNILFGEDDGVRHSQFVLIRKMRHDDNGDKIYCTCMENKTTREPDPDCSYCLGEGFLWDEYWKLSFWMYGSADTGLVRKDIYQAAGIVNADYKIFFLRYDTEIYEGDKIIEVKLDVEGEPVLPYVREAIHKPQTLGKRRADNGRIEFIVAYCKENDALRPERP